MVSETFLMEEKMEYPYENQLCEFLCSDVSPRTRSLCGWRARFSTPCHYWYRLPGLCSLALLGQSHFSQENEEITSVLPSRQVLSIFIFRKQDMTIDYKTLTWYCPWKTPDFETNLFATIKNSHPEPTSLH